MDAVPVKVLLIDDTPADRILTAELLASSERTHFEVAPAATYHDGLRELREGDHDVCLIDYRLGVHDGLQLLREARAAGCRVPMIMLTGIDDPAIDEEALEAGAADYLVKGTITEPVLRRAIRYAMERRRTEEALRVSEMKFRSVTQSASDAIIAADADGNIISWNKGARAIFGYSEESVLGRPLVNLLAVRQRTDYLERIADGSWWSGAATVEMHGLAGSGFEFPVELSVSRWATAQGQFISWIVRDISDRKLIQDRLERERNLLRSLIDNIPDRIYVKDLDGHYVLNNRAHRDYLGVRRLEDIIGKSTFDILPAALAAKYHADDVVVLRSGDILADREELGIDPTGQEVWMSTTKVPLRDPQGNVNGLLGISRDITARKHAQEQQAHAERALRGALADLERSHEELKSTQLVLIQTEKLESLGRLAAGIAHEVKNPLAQIILGIDLIAHVLPPDDETMTMVVDDIRHAVTRADNIVRGLLDFSAPNELDLRLHDINPVVKQSLLLLKSEMMTHRVSVLTELGADLPPVEIDEVKIEQVLINLCTNAIHASPPGSELRVRTYAKRIEDGERDEGAKVTDRIREGDTVVVAEVTDCGHGIPPEKIANIFDPFFTTKPTGKGTGLGLTVTRKIIELHGGQLIIVNRPEGGVIAAFMLKARTPAEPTLANSPST